MRSRNPILHGACFFLVYDQVANGLGRGMCRVQVERLIGQRLGFQPIGFYNGLRVLDQGIGQNGAGESIAFIQFVGFTQQLKGFCRLPLRKQFLAFRDKAVSFSIALDAILGELFQFGKLRIVTEFAGFVLVANPGRESSRPNADRC